MSIRVLIYNYSIAEFANANRLQQDHPCVVELIRKLYLYEPAPIKSLNLSFPTVLDQSPGQSKVILSHLRNQVIFRYYKTIFIFLLVI
jgi:hypothetical protein